MRRIALAAATALLIGLVGAPAGTSYLDSYLSNRAQASPSDDYLLDLLRQQQQWDLADELRAMQYEQDLLRQQQSDELRDMQGEIDRLQQEQDRRWLEDRGY